VPERVDIPHRDILARCLATLGTDPDHLLGYDVLAGGASGASVYRLRFPPGDLVLKVTRPESPAYLLERARREIQFYRHLASNVQVQVPRVIASRCDNAIGACLLLEAYEPSHPPAAWTETRYVQAAEQLGRFHAAFWGEVRDLSTFGWLRRIKELAEADIRRASTHWERLRAEGRFETVLTPERYLWILDLLRRIREVGTDPSTFPITLCHGDFHIDNILMDRGGGMVFADWQEVGPGLGPEDLSFFLQRASSAGGTVPRGAMIDAYRRSLAANTDADVSVSDIRRVMDAAELQTRLLHWPAYLTDASEDQLTDLLDRIRVLAAGLETSFAPGS